MLDIPGYPVLDKQALVGGCVRLPLRIDAARLNAEVDALPPSLWGTTGPRIGVHDAAEALFLRGYLPAEGDKPFDERPALAHLPYVREIITAMIPASPLRCLLAKLPAAATILPHIDRAPYFAKTLRVHVPVDTHERVFMLCDGQHYVMRPGEAWVLNNSAVHGVWNDSAERARTHLICDFLASPGLLELLARGDRELGRKVPEVREHFLAVSERPAQHPAAGGG
jgi:hypothetical protein